MVYFETRLFCDSSKLGPTQQIPVIDKANHCERMLVNISDIKKLCCYIDMEDYKVDFLSLLPYKFVMN